MKIVTEKDLDGLQGSEKYWAYNAMDCCVTREVWDTLRGKMNPQHWETYRFRMACQSPAMAMMLRGLKVDEARRKGHIGRVKGLIVEGQERLQSMVGQWWSKVGKVPAGCVKGGKHQWPRDKRKKHPNGGWVVVDAAPPVEEQQCMKCGSRRIDRVPFEPTSHQQCQKLLYEDMGLRKQMNKQRKVSVDKECLDRLARKYPAHKEIILLIRQVRLWDKLRGMLESRLDPDGRWRYSLNIGATETGRPSSSESPMRTGSNTQNIPEQMRDMFVADPGWVMFNADLKTAESFFVAHKAGDEGYIKAHKGDVHTLVCRGLYPHLPWTKPEDEPDPIARVRMDKAIAETNPPWSPEPGHTYRFHSKRRQHGGNYGMTAFAMAIQLHIKVEQARRDIERYYTLFPRIPMWQGWVRTQVREQGRMVSALGMQRQFFGRGWDEHTVREALAFEPQNVIADLVQIAMWHIWKRWDPGVVRLFQNGYDSLLGEVREDMVDELMPLLLREMEMGVEVEDIEGQKRVMVIPAEIAVGRNWGKWHPERNPQGMKEWKGGEGSAAEATF